MGAPADSGTLVLWDPALSAYDFGREHPMRPLRLELTMALAEALGVLDRPGVTVAAPDLAEDDLLELVHDPAYLAAVRRAPDDLIGRLSLRFGLGTADNPIFPGMHEASALVAGGSVAAARAVWEGTAVHAVNIAGGLHHALRDRASGFCVYNDPAVAIAWLLQAGAQRVAYVDVDVHHGDGVQAAFAADPRVLTVSLHESGSTLFPGTGWPEEVGSGPAAGSIVNVALPAGTGDPGWLRAFHAIVPPVLREFAPEVLVTQSGCDSHALDPLAHLLLSVEGQHASYAALHEMAHELCGGRWIALGGGGYDPVRVVPRAWTGLLAVATGGPVSGQTPERWRELVRQRVGPAAAVPEFLGDGAEVGVLEWEGGAGDPDDPLDRAVAATRAHVFPLLGLDPLAARG